MSFGKELKMKCNENLEKDIYEKLKPILLKCANAREKGCKVNFSGIDEIVITNLFQLMKEDEIEVIENNILIWDDTAIEKKLVSSPPNPCFVCSLKSACCGCPEKREWDRKNKKEEKTIYNVSSVIEVSYSNNHLNISAKIGKIGYSF